MQQPESGSGLRAPTLFLAGFAIASSLASAQAPAQRVPAAAQVAAPDSLTVNKLVWSTLAAVDHANITGNYGMLRDLGAPGFQANNTAATLAGVFQAVRNQRVDLSNTLLLAPVYDFPPAIVQGGLLRVRGRFALRPIAVGFDLLYAPVAGRWQLFGIAVVPLPMPNAQAAPQGR